MISKTGKRYMVLDSIGNPVMQKGDMANPYIFYSLFYTYRFIERELLTHNSLTVVELTIIEKTGSGM